MKIVEMETGSEVVRRRTNPGRGKNNIVEIVRQVTEEMNKNPRRYNVKKPREKSSTPGRDKPVKRVVKKPRQEDAIARIAKQVHAIIVEPQLAIMLGSILLALYVHHYHADESIISRAVSSLKANPATLQLGQWLELNVPKFFGILIAAVMSFMVSNQYGVSLAVASVLIIIVMPATSVTFYIITSLFCLLMTRLKTAVDRYIIIAIAAVVYLYFMADSKINGVVTTTANATNKTNFTKT